MDSLPRAADAEARIAAAIEDHGPIGFDEYMTLALYGSGGFYDRPPVGPGGDFVTSPHVHPVFVTLLARAIEELRTSLGDPDPFALVEVGGGDGTLLRGLLAELRSGTRATAVEISAGAREAIGAGGGADAVHATLAEVTGPIHLVLAHEVLDNLPFRLFRADEGPALREVLVDVDPGSHRLRETLGTRSGGAETFATHRVEPPEGLEPGDEVVLPVGALGFVEEVAARLTHGYVLVIDYGAHGSSGGPAHGYRGHRVIEDLLAAPGTADITAGVDVELIARRAREAGLDAFEDVSQFHALRALGFEGWMREELSRQVSLLDEREGLEAVRVWTGRSRATLLVDPAALGRMRWLLLATPGLPAPSWLAEALAV
jgi:SAM-dependent MidA family methyltransferase